MAALQPNLSLLNTPNVLGAPIPSGTGTNLSAPKSSYINSIAPTNSNPLASLNLSNIGTPPQTGVTNKNVLPPGFGGLNTSGGATAPTATKITAPTNAIAPSATTGGLGSYKGVAITPGSDAQVAAQVAAIDASGATGGSNNPALATPAAQGYIASQTDSTGTTLPATPITPTVATTTPIIPGNTNPGVGNTTNANGSVTDVNGNVISNPADTSGVQTINTGNPSYDNAVNAYLAALNTSNGLSASAQNQQISDRNAENADLNATGGTVGGNQQTSALDTRNNDLALANLSSAETTATNASDEALKAAEFEQSVLPTAPAPYTLSPGDERFDANGNPVAYVAPNASSTKTVGTPATGVYQQNADGSWTEAIPPTGGDNVQSLAQGLVSGLIAPQDLSKRSSGVGSLNDILTAAQKIDPSFSIAKATTDYTFANNVQTQNTLNLLGSLTTNNGDPNASPGGSLGNILAISDSISDPKGFLGLGQTNFPALNDASQWAAIESGNPAVASYYAALTETADQVAKVLQGGGGSGTSDAKLAQAQALFNKGFTKEQMAGVVGQLQTLLTNRASSMIKDNPYLSSYAQQFGITQNNNLPGNSSSTDIGTGSADSIDNVSLSL